MEKGELENFVKSDTMNGLTLYMIDEIYKELYYPKNGELSNSREDYLKEELWNRLQSLGAIVYDKIIEDRYEE